MTSGIKVLLTCLLLCFVSCKPDTFENQLTAEVEGTSTKTHLEPNIPNRLFEVKWDANDLIMVYGDDGTGGVFTNSNIYDDDNNQVAHFTGSGLVGPTFSAFYPTSIAVNSNTFELPEEQQYTSRSNGYVIDYPMYAQATNSNHLYFRNLCGLVVLRIKGPAGTQVRKIGLNEPSDPIGAPMSGKFSVSGNGNTYENTPTITVINPKYDAILNLTNSPVTLIQDSMELFYLYVPQGSYKWMIAYIEYKLQGSSTWQTARKSIYPDTYGAYSFTFTRSQWSKVDVDFTDLADAGIYDASNIVLDPNQPADTVINTHTSITQSYSSYTFLVDVTPTDVSATSYDDMIQKAIYSEMDYDSPWNGPLIRIDAYSGVPYYQFTIGSTRCQGPHAANNQRQKFVCVVDASANKMYIYYLNGSSFTSRSMSISSSMWITVSNPIPMIGGDQHKPGRYFDGTIHYFKIYNSVLSQTQIRSFLNS